MQIYEVFGLGAIKNAIGDYGADANAQKAQRQQDKYAASAAQSAEQLRRQGYGQTKPDPTVNQLISQVQNDSAAQQLVQTWAAQWPKIAATVPALKPKAPAPPPAAAPAAIPAAAFGGQSLDPNDPTTARIISQLRAQGKLTEQQTTQPDPDEYRKKFVEWADNVVERTVRQPGVVNQIKQSTKWAQQFDQAADAVVKSAADTQANARAVQAYLTLAVAAARAAQQDSPRRAGAPITSGLDDPRADTLAQVLGIDATDLTKLNAFVRRNGETVNPQGTGSQSLDALLRAAKLLR
jgi:hypothetical protein